MFRKNALHYKLHLFITSLLFMTLATVSLIIVQIVTWHLSDKATVNTERVATSFEQSILKETRDHLEEHVDLLVNNPTFISLVKGHKRTDLLETYSAVLHSKEVDFLSIRFDDGTSISGGTIPEGLESLISSRDVSSYQKRTVWVDGNRSLGLYLLVVMPINSENMSVGHIVTGIKLSKQENVDAIKTFFGMDATIFIEDTRAVTTIMIDGIPQNQTRLDPSIARPLLSEGISYTGRANILGLSYIASYKPILGLDNEPIGALFVGQSMESIQNMKEKITTSVTSIAVILFVLSMILSKYWVSLLVTTPLSKLQKRIEAFRNESGPNGAIPSQPDHVMSDEIESLHKAYAHLSASLQAQQVQLERMAYTQPSTSLPNRAALVGKYGQNDFGHMTKQLGFLFYLNIDNMKMVNDLIGHSVGDTLITQVGSRLSQHLSTMQNINLYHLSGDEFIITHEGNFNVEEMRSVAESVLNAFSEHFTIDMHTLKVQASMGIAYCEGHHEENGKPVCDTCDNRCRKTLDSLMKDAEIALYEAKSRGKNHYRFFDDSMYEALKRRVEIESAMVKSMETGGFSLHYQPKYSLEDQRIIGFEALIRWHDDTLGTIPPATFIPLAEEKGLIIPLGRWVIEEACSFIKRFNASRGTSMHIAVNVSPIQLMSDTFVEELLMTIEKLEFDPSLLELEITESILMESIDEVVDKLDLLLSMGISVALDDFGSGYSSLSYLRQIPITVLKIDRSFVTEIDKNPSEHNLITDMVRMGHRLGLEVVAEGVENDSQLQYLRNCDCDIIQGYLFSKPLEESVAISIPLQHLHTSTYSM